MINVEVGNRATKETCLNLQIQLVFLPVVCPRCNRSKSVWWRSRSRRCPTPGRTTFAPAKQKHVIWLAWEGKEVSMSDDSHNDTDFVSLVYFTLRRKCYRLREFAGLLAWLMLHTTTEGKNTSESGTVIVSTVVTTCNNSKSIVVSSFGQFQPSFIEKTCSIYVICCTMMNHHKNHFHFCCVISIK